MLVHQGNMAGQPFFEFGGKNCVYGCTYCGVAVIQTGDPEASWKQ